jgi:hypothetical protein
MSKTIRYSQVIDRPVSTVWQFFAVDHVRNHPRWDPAMELEQITEGPIGTGTVIRRRHTHYGEAVEGTMEVVEFEPLRRMGVQINDGTMEMRSWLDFVALDDHRTRLDLAIEIPGMDESADMSEMMSLVEAASQRRKQLIESET